MLNEYTVRLNGDVFGVFSYYDDDYLRVREQAYDLAFSLYERNPSKTVEILLTKTKLVYTLEPKEKRDD